MASSVQKPIYTKEQLKQKRKKKEITVFIFIMFCAFIYKLYSNDIKKMQVKIRKVWDTNMAAKKDEADAQMKLAIAKNASKGGMAGLGIY